MDEQEKIIASLRKQLENCTKKNSAMEQEIALQNDEISRLKRQLINAKKLANL